jgi:hypothetical protein
MKLSMSYTMITWMSETLLDNLTGKYRNHAVYFMNE